MTPPTQDPDRNPSGAELDVLKFRLEQARYRTDILKWVVIAIGAIVSFAVIDYGKLRLDRSRALADSQRQLLQAYLTATESAQPEVWKRKLHILHSFATDDRTREWARSELEFIEEFGAVDALYRETMKIASQLVEPSKLNDPERIQARIRYNQLYWADLPYAGETRDVESAMVHFRNKLIAAESVPGNANAWHELNLQLIDLSQTLRKATPPFPLRADTTK